VRVYIVGSGAVGSYLGDLLRGIGNEVVFAPRALDDVEPLDAELAIVAVKSYDTPSAVITLERALRDPAQTTILTAQNGIGNEELLAAAFGADAVMAAALTVPVGRDDSGAAVATRGGGIAFAPVGTASPNNWLLAAFAATGMPTTAVRDYRSLKWSKLALNIVANASCAILDMLPDRMVRHEDVFALEIRALREVRATMKALGIAVIDLPRYPVRALLAIAALPTPLARAAFGLADRGRARLQAAIAAARPPFGQAPHRGRRAQRRRRPRRTRGRRGCPGQHRLRTHPRRRLPPAAAVGQVP
jgi:2-dehydropantoate 2-reductase